MDISMEVIMTRNDPFYGNTVFRIRKDNEVHPDKAFLAFTGITVHDFDKYYDRIMHGKKSAILRKMEAKE